MQTTPRPTNHPEATIETGGLHPGRPGSTSDLEASSNGAKAATAIDDPGQLIRMGVMLSKLNDELKEVSLDERTVDRLYELHSALLGALTDNLGLELASELSELMPALDADRRSAAEVRLAHLQLSGWLEGLFQGIQLSVAGQQLRAQLGAMEAHAAEASPQTDAQAAEASPQTTAVGTYL